VPLLLSVRRLVPRMGLADLIEAVRRLREGGTRARAAIAGEGPERAALERAVRTAGLQDEVRLLGRVPDQSLPALYRAATAFVLPTRSLEGFGLATAEALASGLPWWPRTWAPPPSCSRTWKAARSCHPASPRSSRPSCGACCRPAAPRAGRRRRAHAGRALGDWDAHVLAVEEAALRATAARSPRR
jgi:glycosyltransferase involved in cell wall biosynthesis